MIPSVMLKSPAEPVFLDDITVTDIENALKVKICVTAPGGDELFYKMYSIKGDE